MNKKNSTIQNLLHLPIGTITNYSPLKLYCLLHEVDKQLISARRAKKWLEWGIAIKYSNEIKLKRAHCNQQLGVIHVEDKGMRITQEIPKKIFWDQQKLSNIVADIAKITDPLEYVDVTYNIPENKFRSWPKSVQQIFMEARIVTAGNSICSISKINHNLNEKTDEQIDFYPDKWTMTVGDYDK
jgi:hypothetical protein